MTSQTVLWPPAGCMSRVSRLIQLPAAHAPSIRTAAFSTTARQCKRKTKDRNKKRGVSSLYRSGPRQHLSMSDVPLPKPCDFKPEVAVDQDHGLWGFFPAQGKLLETPQEVMAHGRAWTVEELRRKSWKDLHSLWWLCCRERNMLATSKAELVRAKLGYGEREYEERDLEVRRPHGCPTRPMQADKTVAGSKDDAAHQAHADGALLPVARCQGARLERPGDRHGGGGPEHLRAIQRGRRVQRLDSARARWRKHRYSVPTEHARQGDDTLTGAGERWLRAGEAGQAAMRDRP